MFRIPVKNEELKKEILEKNQLKNKKDEGQPTLSQDVKQEEKGSTDGEKDDKDDDKKLKK